MGLDESFNAFGNEGSELGEQHAALAQLAQKRLLLIAVGGKDLEEDAMIVGDGKGDRVGL